MKKNYMLLAFAFIMSNLTIAQTNVVLRINHKLGTTPFQMNTSAQNNIPENFKVTRLEYYITRISVVHDGGNILPISDEVVALINANVGPYSSVDLGQLNVTSVEGVKFHIGVFQPLNNENPALQPAGSPLAPQSPSMHWGWASGYRFLAYEGTAGMNFSQTFQFHALGNSNYYEVEVPVSGQMLAGSLIIPIDGDYVKGMQDIVLSSGPIAHGVDLEDLDCLLNFKNLVFSASSAGVGIETLNDLSDFNFYPNPSSDKFYVQNSSAYENVKAEVVNLSGQIISTVNLEETNEISVANAGLYFVKIYSDDLYIGTQKITKR